MQAQTKKITNKKSSQSSKERSDLINQGLIETKNLAECLEVDFLKLYSAIFTDINNTLRNEIKDLVKIGILKRMKQTAQIILREHGENVIKKLTIHPSDTARGWAAFMIGQIPNISLKKRMEMIKPFADDLHFGVREWAWMAVRPHIAEDLEKSIKILLAWSQGPSFRVRRFSIESIRPRGVWAEHINILKQNPEMAMPILNVLKSDPERYVQDAVANWLNDASKSQPKWVKKISKEWNEQSQSDSTKYITKRAQRSMK